MLTWTAKSVGERFGAIAWAREGAEVDPDFLKIQPLSVQEGKEMGFWRLTAKPTSTSVLQSRTLCVDPPPGCGFDADKQRTKCLESLKWKFLPPMSRNHEMCTWEIPFTQPPPWSVRAMQRLNTPSLLFWTCSSRSVAFSTSASLAHQERTLQTVISRMSCKRPLYVSLADECRRLPALAATYVRSLPSLLAWKSSLLVSLCPVSKFESHFAHALERMPTCKMRAHIY